MFERIIPKKVQKWIFIAILEFTALGLIGLLGIISKILGYELNFELTIIRIPLAVILGYLGILMATGKLI